MNDNVSQLNTNAIFYPVEGKDYINPKRWKLSATQDGVITEATTIWHRLFVWNILTEKSETDVVVCFKAFRFWCTQRNLLLFYEWVQCESRHTKV